MNVQVYATSTLVFQAILCTTIPILNSGLCYLQLDALLPPSIFLQVMLSQIVVPSAAMFGHQSMDYKFVYSQSAISAKVTDFESKIHIHIHPATMSITDSITETSMYKSYLGSASPPWYVRQNH